MKNFGLKPTKHDPRDYSYHKTFGAISTALALPDEYFAGHPVVKNQYLSQFCTAFGAYAVAACEDGVDFSPEWFFAQEKALTGDPLDQPEDLRTPCNTACQKGFLPQAQAPFTLADKDPLFLADARNWPASGLTAASIYKKKSYFHVEGDFDAVRRVLYENSKFKRAILTGVLWYNDWTTAPNGIVPDFSISPAGLHCIAIIGFTKKNGIDYLVVQNSYGEEIGDHGLFYFDRATFNENFTEPMFMFVDYDGSEPAPMGNWLSILFFTLKKLFL